MKKPGLSFRLGIEADGAIRYVSLAYGSVPIYRVTLEEFEEFFGYRATSKLLREWTDYV